MPNTAELGAQASSGGSVCTGSLLALFLVSLAFSLPSSAQPGSDPRPSLSLAASLSRAAASTAGDPQPRAENEASETGGSPNETEETPRSDDVVIIATRSPKTPYELTVATDVVDERELREKTPRTPAEALRRRPGVWVQKTGHLGGAPILRGFMGNRVLYMFDGIRRNTAGLFKGPNSFLQNIDALDVDRIEVIRGPGSVLYGSDAIGGVIDVRTNEEPVFSSSGRTGGRFLSQYGSADREMSGRIEGFYSDSSLYTFVGGTLRDIGDLRAGRGGGVQDPSDWRERNWDAQVDYRLDENRQFEIFFQDFSRPRGRRFDRPNWIQTNDRQLLGARLRAAEMGPLEDVEATVYLHDQQSFIDEKFWDSDSDEQTIGFDIQATSHPFDSGKLTYGVHFHRDDIEKSNPQKGTRDPDVTWDNPAAFVLGEWAATDRLTIDAGLRLDVFQLDSTAPAFGELDSVLQDAINNGAFSLADLELSTDDTALTGGVGASYEVRDGVNLVGHIGRGFRAPNKSDMLSFGQFTFGFNVPSPDLSPESSWTSELGVHVERDSYAAALTGFYTELDDAITSAPGTFNGQSFVDVNGNGTDDAGEQVFVKTNSAGTVRAVGVEFEARAWLPRDWSRAVLPRGELSAYGNASWIRGEDTDTGEPLDRAYPANALLGLRVDQARDPHRSRWFAEVETWLVAPFDRIPSTRRTSDPAFHEDPQDPSSPLIGGDGSLPGFGVVNARGGVSFGESSRLTLGIENLFDRKYRVKDSRIDAPGLSVVVGYSLSF